MSANATSIDFTVNCSSIAHSSDPTLLSAFSSCDNDSYVHHNSISHAAVVATTPQSLLTLLQSTALQLNAEFGLNETVDASNVTLHGTKTSPDQEYINFLDGTRFWIQRVFVPLLTIIGVLGNSMTIIIMTRRRMRSSTNCYLAALATFDMMYLIFVFVLSLQHYPNMNAVKYFYYWKGYPFFLMIVDACTNISVWLTVTFTIERFIVVSHPIKGKVICTESRAKKVILGVFLICFTFVIPTPFEWIIIETIHPRTNQTIITPIPSELGNNRLYKMIFSWVYSILFVFIPLLLLAIFNSFLIRSVHLSKKQRSVMTQSKLRNTGKSSHTGDTNNVGSARPSGSKFDQSSKQETKITVMLISVVILFLICQLPVAGSLIYSSVRTIPEGTNEFCLLTGLNNIFNFMVAVNAAGNFVLYCLLSEKYRRTLVKLFCPCLKGKLSHLQSSYHQTLYSKTTGAGKFGFETDDTELKNFDAGKRGSSASPQTMKNALESKPAAEERNLLNATRDNGRSKQQANNNNSSNQNQRSNVSVPSVINANKQCCVSSGTDNAADTNSDVENREKSKTVGETRSDCDVSDKE